MTTYQHQPAPNLYRYAQMMHLAAGRLKYTQETIDRSTLDELIRLTPPEVVERSFGVQLLNKTYTTGTKEDFRRTNRKYPSIYNEAAVSARSKAGTGSGEVHKCYIRFFGPPKGSTPCWVWCDCSAFTFTLEVALADQHSSVVKNSNGEPPTIKNPNKIGYLCKHLYRAAQWALSQRRDLALKEWEKREKTLKKETPAKKR